MKKQRNFIYWALDLLALLFIGVILLAHYLHLSPAWEQALLIIAIVLVYSLIILWWWANPTARIEPDTTRAKLAGRVEAKRGPYLTEVQAHYQQVIGMNSKRKL